MHDKPLSTLISRLFQASCLRLINGFACCERPLAATHRTPTSLRCQITECSVVLSYYMAGDDFLQEFVGLVLDDSLMGTCF